MYRALVPALLGAAVLSACSHETKTAAAPDIAPYVSTREADRIEYAVPNHLLFATDSSEVLPTGHKILEAIAGAAKRRGVLVALQPLEQRHVWPQDLQPEAFRGARAGGGQRTGRQRRGSGAHHHARLWRERIGGGDPQQHRRGQEPPRRRAHRQQLTFS